MKRKATFIVTAAAAVMLFCILCIFSEKMPMQDLKITAVTATKEFDLSGTTDIYCFEELDTGELHTAVIRFMAVEDTTGRLFVSRGRGQWVYFGCSELKAECGFMSLGRFVHVKLTLKALEKDLKLEDGTPFDITRYSLKPVLTIGDGR